MAAVRIHQVDKIYGSSRHDESPAVQQLTMHVDEGEIIGLLGSSGCGKSSTLRMIAGLESISAGEIRIGERLINNLRAGQRNVAMAFEGYALYPPLNVRDNIAFGLLRDKTPKAEIERKVQAIAKLLEIEDILGRYPPSLSGGQQQRVSLARALVRNADLYLLDEPMSQLEPQLRAILRARIKDYLIQHNMTTIFVTHDQTEAIALADRIAVMENGVLQQFASPDELRDRPSNLFVASFIGEPPMNIFSGRVETDAAGISLQITDETGQPAFTLGVPQTLISSAARTALSDQRPIYVGIRPHKIRLNTDSGAESMPISGTVVSNQWLGDQTHIGIEVGRCVLIAVSDGSLNAPLDSPISAALPIDALHIFDHDPQQAILHGMSAAE